MLSFIISNMLVCLLLAIDGEEGVLCQSRDPQGWHGTRSNKGVTGKGNGFRFLWAH